MYNSENPFGYEPPSSAKLLRSTVLAAVVAAVLLVTVVLPSEYGIDPTGIGAAIGLKRMGEIKVQLAEEAEADAAADLARVEAAAPAEGEAASTGADGEGSAGTGAPAAAPADGWRDELSVVLAPDEALELKLVMGEGAVAHYSWSADGGALNFNKHGDGGGQSIEYDKGRGVPAADGSLRAAFDGHHGWFWRNRSGNPVKLTLRTRGDYSALKRTM